MMKVSLMILVLALFSRRAHQLSLPDDDDIQLGDPVQLKEVFQARLAALEAELEAEKVRRIHSEAGLQAEIDALRKRPLNLLMGAVGRASAMPADCRGIYSNNPNPPNGPPAGFYLVKAASNKRIDVVFCDFTESIDAETRLGYLDVKTSPVFFYVQRTSSWGRISTVIPWDVAKLNDGGGMSLETGVFTAPRNGTYHFSFTGSKDLLNSALSIYLRKNGINQGVAYGADQSNWLTASLHATLNLVEGDQVSLFLAGGTLFDSNDHHAHFTGWLMEEDLSLTA